MLAVSARRVKANGTADETTCRLPPSAGREPPAINRANATSRTLSFRPSSSQKTSLKSFITDITYKLCFMTSRSNFTFKLFQRNALSDNPL
jgi:hypothetical protein